MEDSKPTRIALLQLDEVEPDLQPRFGNLAKMMKSMLDRTALCGFVVDVFNLPAGEEPVNLSEYDGFLLTGSRSSVFEELPWIQRLLTLIRAIHDLRIKTVGICFGHQAIAQALNGQVVRHPEGWGVGVHQYEVSPTFRYGTRIDKESVSLPCCHQDQVVALPTNARKTLSNQFCENAGFVIDDHVFAIQAHPEFSVQYLECILRRIEHRVGERTESALSSLQCATDNSLIADYIARFFLGTHRSEINEAI